MHNIKENDFLWRFYCKRFTIENKEIRSPKSLCNYSWTALDGFRLWLSYEVRLLTLWLICLASIFLLSVLDFMPDVKNSFIAIILGIVITSFILVILLAFAVTVIRICRKINVKVKNWIIGISIFLIFCAIAVGAYIDIAKGTFWPRFEKFLSEVFHCFIYAISIAAVILIIAFIISRISHRRLERPRRFFQVIGTFIIARIWKNLCPSVNPPKEFKTKH